MSRSTAAVCLVFAIVLAGCGSGGGDGAVDGPTGAAISGQVSKGPVTGAAVSLYQFNPDGSRGALVAGPMESDRGAWEGTLPVGSEGPFLVVAVGGSYVDEATGATVTLRPDDELLGMLPAGGTQAAVTPFSHLAVMAARAHMPSHSPETTLSQAIDDLTAALGFDPVATLPPDPDAITPGATPEELRYTALLGGLSHLLADSPELAAAGLGGAPVLMLVFALLEDLADGALDGLGPDGTPLAVDDGTGSGTEIPLPALDPAGLGVLSSAANGYTGGHPELSGTTFGPITLTFQEPPLDEDSDGVADGEDNCPDTVNPGQSDGDGDGIGDACDDDGDNDGVANGSDNCPSTPNALQEDGDGDGVGDLCDGDCNPSAECTTDYTPVCGTDGVTYGNACEAAVACVPMDHAGACQVGADGDGDGIANDLDNCPVTVNPNQEDGDEDGVGDACDPLDDPGAAQDTFTGNELLAVAAGLYSNPLGTDVTDLLTAFFQDFGMPILFSGADRVALQEVLDSGMPFISDGQVANLGRAFAAGHRFSLRSVAGQTTSPRTTGALASHQVRPTAAGTDLSKEYLRDQVLAAGVVDKLDTNGVFTDYDMVPGLLVALARTRSEMRGLTMHDPVWGSDDMLDPLQFWLLSSAALYSSSADAVGLGTAQRAARYVPDWIKQKLAKGIVDGAFKDILDVPATPQDAVEAIACGSAVLHSYSFQVDSDQGDVFPPLRDPTDSIAPVSFDDGPDRANITATLMFEPLDDTWAAMLEEMLGCEIPFGNPTSPRAVAGKNVTWEVIGDLRYHGGLYSDLAHPDNHRVTDANGTAYATFTAGEQVVPPYLRTLQSYAPGWVWVKATNLMNKWTGLEAGVDLMKNPTGTPIQIEARYYGPSIGIRYSGGERILTVNDGTGNQYEAFPGTSTLTAHPDVETWREGGETATGTQSFTMNRSSAEGTGSAEFTMEGPVSGSGTELRVAVATAAVGAGGGVVRVRNAALFDIINPHPQRDLLVDWTFADSGPSGTDAIRMLVGKQNSSEVVPLPFTQNSTVGSGTERLDLGSHEYVVLEITSADSVSSGSGGDSSWTGEITVRMVE